MEENRSRKVEEALQKLGDAFPSLPWNFVTVQVGKNTEEVSQWLGGTDEDVSICVFKGHEIHERFHRQDFFFLNYAYAGTFGAMSRSKTHHIEIKEDECCLGQPFSGYALYGSARKKDEELVIVGVLIRKEVFYRSFFPFLSADERLVNFFLTPEHNAFSDDFLLFSNLHCPQIRTLLEEMVLEYAFPQENSQEVLRSETATLLLLLSREYQKLFPKNESVDVETRMLRYIDEHLDTVTLTTLATAFGYHPAYVSTLLSKRCGTSFSKILRAHRMDRALLLLSNTDLSVEEVAAMVGYADKSSFYRAFRAVHGRTPAQVLEDKAG